MLGRVEQQVDKKEEKVNHDCCPIPQRNHFYFYDSILICSPTRQPLVLFLPSNVSCNLPLLLHHVND